MRAVANIHLKLNGSHPSVIYGKSTKAQATNATNNITVLPP